MIAMVMMMMLIIIIMMIMMIPRDDRDDEDRNDRYYVDYDNDNDGGGGDYDDDQIMILKLIIIDSDDDEIMVIIILVVVIILIMLIVIIIDYDSDDDDVQTYIQDKIRTNWTNVESLFYRLYTFYLITCLIFNCLAIVIDETLTFDKLSERHWSESRRREIMMMIMMICRCVLKDEQKQLNERGHFGTSYLSSCIWDDSSTEDIDETLLFDILNKVGKNEGEGK